MCRSHVLMVKCKHIYAVEIGLQLHDYRDKKD
jgi:hypothetical protein